MVLLGTGVLVGAGIVYLFEFLETPVSQVNNQSWQNYYLKFQPVADANNFSWIRKTR